MNNKIDILIDTVTANIYRSSMSEQEIDEIISFFANSPQFKNNPFSNEELEKVRNKIHSDYLIKLDLGISLVSKNHVKWFGARKNDLETKYWDRYRRYLLQDKKFAPNVVKTMDEVSDDLTDLLGDPTISANFQRRGLIIGDVQSGKTANYIGLICKAADAGYKVIVLLTGTIEKLRQQTQKRLDEGFVGMDSNGMLNQKEDVYVGVGRHDSTLHPAVFTSKSDDFNVKLANNLRITLNTLNEPVLFVIKKNVTVLKRLNQWLKTFNINEGATQINTSLLMIDDEADNASINVHTEDEEPTAINNQIRIMLSLFKKASYVGFTATPFANIFINPDTNEEMEREDLFPKDYIYSLDSPTNYIGARNIFGEFGEHSNMIETIKDGEIYFPLIHKKDDIIKDLPQSLKNAIRQFFIANAIRDLRGDVLSHRSMIVNVSRFVNIQNQINNLVENYVNNLKNSIRLYSKLSFEEAMNDDNLNKLYNTYKQSYSNLEFSWSDIQKILNDSTNAIMVNVVNGKNFNKLDYESNEKNGLRVIVVGGMSLSRGLTLEGLIISYFYRNSKMYDTLMQMGRWFGYRPNYHDLCKIWMDENNKEWYKHISEATDELRRDIKIMRELDKTPLEFGLRVRNDINSLLVTARNKMRTAQAIERVISMSETYLEMTKLYNNDLKNRTNIIAVNNLLASIQYKGKILESRGKNKGYKDVDKEIIIDFLNNFDSSYANFPFDISTIKEFINNYPTSELSTWDVVFINGESKKTFCLDKNKENDAFINCVERSYMPRNNGKLIQMSATKNRLGTANDSKFGLLQSKIDEIENNFRQNFDNKGKAVPQREYFKIKRNPLLMIYMITLGQNKSDETVDIKVDEPFVGISIGFPVLPNVSTKFAKYKINIIELRNQREFEEMSSDDDYED